MKKKKIKQLLTILFLFICALIFISEFSIFYVFKQQEYSGEVINISGRQRMLNQKLTKSTLLLIQNKDKFTNQLQKEEIKNVLNQFKNSHTSLIYGNSDSHLSSHHSEEIDTLFKQIQPHFDNTVKSIEKVLNSPPPDEETSDNIQRFVDSQKSNFDILYKLLDDEKKFLILMDEIVTTYEKENRKQINTLKLTLLITGGLIVLIILIVGYLVNENVKNSSLLFQKSLIIEKQNKRLQKVSEELQQNNEQLKTLNKNTTLQKEYLIGVNQDLANAMGVAKNQQTIIEFAHEKINSSLSYAKKLQDALLPEQENVNNQLKNYFVLYKPKDIVSGDFYYVNKIQNKLIFTVGDCTGHGVPGAFMTILSLTFMNEIIRRDTKYIPANILEQLRIRVKEIFKRASTYSKNGLDLALCVVDTQTNILEYAGAHNPLWLIRNGNLIEYKATRAPIGNHPKHINFENTTIQLQNNDLIYLSSDGYYDQFGGEKDVKLGKKVFKKFLLEIQDLQPKEQKELLDKKLVEWQMGHSQIDDITVMGVKWVC